MSHGGRRDKEGIGGREEDRGRTVGQGKRKKMRMVKQEGEKRRRRKG